jgi:hypothetical protein
MQVLAGQSLRGIELLPMRKSAFRSSYPSSYAYWAEGNGGRGQANEAAIPRVRLVDSICVFVAKLMYNLRYPVVILCSECISDEAFELEGAALALVVELIIQSFGDIDIHIQCAA